MTPEQHNKYVGFAHLGYAAIHALAGLVIGVAMLIMLGAMPASARGDQPPPGFFIAMGLFLLVFSIGWSLPSMIAGYAFLKKKSWAKIAGMVAAVFAAAQMPLGTAVSVYTFWFLFSPPGRLLYDKGATSLLPGQQDLAGFDSDKQKEMQYVPPVSPPDWR
jgi:hypothetical protein